MWPRTRSVVMMSPLSPTCWTSARLRVRNCESFWGGGGGEGKHVAKYRQQCDDDTTLTHMLDVSKARVRVSKSLGGVGWKASMLPRTDSDVMMSPLTHVLDVSKAKSKEQLKREWLKGGGRVRGGQRNRDKG